MVRSVPLQAMTFTTDLSGSDCWMDLMVSESTISLFPTLGSTWSTLLMISWIISRSGPGVCLPVSLRLLVWGSIDDSGEISSDLAGRDGARIREITRASPCSLVSPLQACSSGHVWCQTIGFSSRLRHICWATARANLRRYTSVYWLRFIRLPSTLIDPSICWCSCWPWHFLPWIMLNMLLDVVRITKLFRMCFWLMGSRRFPMVQRSHSAAWVMAWISDMWGTSSIFDLLGCSQCICLPCWTWCLHNTIPSAIWYNNDRLWFW